MKIKQLRTHQNVNMFQEFDNEKTIINAWCSNAVQRCTSLSWEKCLFSSSTPKTPQYQAKKKKLENIKCIPHRSKWNVHHSIYCTHQVIAESQIVKNSATSCIHYIRHASDCYSASQIKNQTKIPQIVNMMPFLTNKILLYKIRSLQK